MIAANGYESIKAGPNLSEFADFAIAIGGWQVANLDGGGSLAMIDNGVIENTCSDSCILGYNSEYHCEAYPGLFLFYFGINILSRC